jgi:hypothetical protein
MEQYTPSFWEEINMCKKPHLKKKVIGKFAHMYFFYNLVSLWIPKPTFKKLMPKFLEHGGNMITLIKKILQFKHHK